MKKYSKKDIIRQRILAVVALVGLFACGLMVGLAITKTKTVVQKIENVSEQVINMKKADIVVNNKSICTKVRDEMLIRVNPNAYDYDDHINNAKIYAIIAERGCEDETAYYKELAEQELAVARAITDDKLSEQDTIEVVETYKKLQMQAAAQEMFDKAKRLTNPAIDFILEVEKIINE